MTLRDIEHRGNLPLFDAVTDEAASPRPPSASANASRRMDLPAPVSPVSTRGHGKLDIGRSIRRCHGSKDAPACEFNS